MKFTDKDIEKVVDNIIYGQTYVIASDAEHLPRILAEFKQRKFDIRITFHKDIESDKYYVSADKSFALQRKLRKIKELL